MTWQDLIGAQVAGRYTLRTLLYAGSDQSEFLATASGPGAKPVTIALIQSEQGEAEEELAAITRARQLRHPNVLEILDSGEFVFEGVPMVFVVTEAAEKTLAEVLAAGALTAPAALVADVLAALEWLHEQGLVYKNLEPDTVVRADGRWKLADLSQLHPAGEFGPSDAARRTTPPEAAAGSIQPAWDIWALGVLLQDIFAGQHGSPPAPFDAIVRGCLEPDVNRRISLPDIRKLLKPEPILVSDVLPAPKARFKEPFNEPSVGQSRVISAPIGRLAIGAAVVIFGLLVFAFLHRQRQSAPPPAPRPVSHPAAPPVQPPLKAAAPAIAPPPAPAPAKSKPATSSQHIGRADYFSDDLEGRPTASGEKFSNQAMTAANREFPIGTRLRVTNLQNGHRVIVRVNDRGPHRRGFIISVTRRAAEQLGFVQTGSARVSLDVVK